MGKRGIRTLAVRSGVVLATAALCVLAFTSVAGAGSAAHAKKSGCINKSGEIRFFAAEDLKAVIGTEIGPAGVAGVNAWLQYTNANGGIAGCKVAWDVTDEAFGNDVTTCLRAYRNAIQSKKYDFFVGPTNSACMAALPSLTGAAGKPLMAGIAADHQPFMEAYGPYNFHGSVSTFLEGRGSAVAAKKLGWKSAALMVPNYAYGQDAGKAFQQQFKKDGGKITTQQEPPFDEKDFSKYINAMIAGKPDGIFTAFFGPLIPPFWKQWIGSGNAGKVGLISGLTALATAQVTKTAADIPTGALGYNRAPWQLLSKTKTGAALSALYLKANPKEHFVSEFAYQMMNALQFAKALIEKTGSVQGKDWQAAVETGTFTFDGVYHNGPTYVNPINHMADNCVTVGKNIWDATAPAGFQTTMDPKTFVVTCMDDILDAKEAVQLTPKNKTVKQAAIDAYYAVKKPRN